MALHQYIGARYVPKFYVNSDNTSEWRAGVIYEPLTIVTYNNNSYTSKKPVPANVGNPSANPDYWVATGNYNQQIADLTNRFNDLENEIEEQISNLNSVVYYPNCAAMVADFTEDDVYALVISPEIIIDDVRRVTLKSPALFEWKSTGDNFTHALNNGGYAALIPPKYSTPEGSTSAIDCMPAILDVAYSYCGVNKASGFHLDDGSTVYNVQYQPESGPYLDTAAEHQGIQCSQFIRAVLSGLYYECSKLASESNINLECDDNYPFKDNSGYNMDLAASEMAHYAYAMGWYTRTNMFRDVEIGDLCFFKTKNDPYADLKWEGIGHVALCVGKGSDCIMFVNAGGITFIDGFTKNIIRPGLETDAVDFITYSPIGLAYEDVSYAMTGRCHIPYHGVKLTPKQTVRLPRYTYDYSIGASNEPFYLLKSSDNAHARFGYLTFKGYCSTKDSHAGFIITRGTAESAFPATGTEISTGTRPIEYIIFPVLWNVDGNDKVCTASFSIRLTDTVLADSLLCAYANLDVYD